MADLVAIGYPYMTTAAEAEQEVRRLARDLIIQPDAVAVNRSRSTTTGDSLPAGSGNRACSVRAPA